MSTDHARFYFDFADPFSYLVEHELRAAEMSAGVRAERVPFELRPPPAPLTDTGDPEWAGRWREAADVATGLGIPFSPPALVPWTRKASELFLHAGAHNLGDAVQGHIYSAFFAHGQDIGRIDVLVEIGRTAGLDLTEIKAVLDVDRYDADVTAARRDALAAGIVSPPVLTGGGLRLQDFHNRAALGTLLGAVGG